jgi:dihydrofolate reductase
VRELIVTEFVSLDGVMEAPGGEPGYAHAGWVGRYFSPELGAFKLEEQLAADVLLLGRRTFESFAGAWPERDDPMADKINAMRKVVASTTLGSHDWANTTVVAVELEAAVAAIKAEGGGPVLVAGSRSVVHALLAAGLVDQLNLQIFPLVLGSGMRLLPERPEPLALELLSSRSFPGGVVLQSYAVAGR